MSRVPLLLRLKAQDNDLDKKKIKAQNFFDNNMMENAYNLYGCLYSETGLDEYLIQIAWMQFFGVGVDANQIQAITLLKDRNSGSTYRALGMMYQSIGEYDKAHEYLKLSISKCCFSAYFSLGLLFEEVGKESEAIDVYIDGAKNGMLPCMRKLVLKGLNEDGRKFNVLSKLFYSYKIKVKFFFSYVFSENIESFEGYYSSSYIKKHGFTRFHRYP